VSVNAEIVPALLAAGGHPSKVPFYVAGGVLAAWAVAVSFFGLSRPDFPGSPARSRAVMAASALLVGLTAAMAVATSSKPTKEAEASGTKVGAQNQPTTPAPPADQPTNTQPAESQSAPAS
jgi:hypothetical protein